MPCYRCGRRQSDPARGASPWKRGVRRGAHVLVCPDCQRSADWVAELDRCTACGSTMLVRVLGEVRCRACGSVLPGDAAGGGAGAPTEPGEPLAAEVQAALARIFARTLGT